MATGKLGSMVEAILLDERQLEQASTRDLTILQGLLTVALEEVDQELVRRDRRAVRPSTDPEPRLPM